MSWIPSSERTLAILLLVSVAAVGPAAALSISADGVPDEVEVDGDVSATFEVDDAFTDAPETWTLEGATDLENVGWTVTVYDQDNQIDQETYEDASFEQTLQQSNGGDRVVVEIAGTAPEVANYSYDPAQAFTVASIVKVEGSNPETLGNYSAVHYTGDSREARQAIESASAAIDDAGGNDEAESLLENAISAYEVGNFDNAISIAEEAESTAESAAQSQQTTQLALYGVAALVVLALIVGGIYYWRSQQGPGDRLQ